MLPPVRRVIDVEMIRDGGSFAATYESDGGHRYILFLPLEARGAQPK